MNYNDFSQELASIIDRKIDQVVRSEETVYIMIGYYNAIRQIVKSISKDCSDAEEFQSKMEEIPMLSMFSADDDPDFISLCMMRDYLENYVSAALLPEENDPAYGIINDALENYDWCAEASFIETTFSDIERK